MSKRIAIVVALLSVFVGAAAQEYPYQDKSLSPEERAADLISRLTLEEKTSLMNFNSTAVPRLGIPQYNWWSEALHGIGFAGKATVFPMPVAMASSFDDELLREIFTKVSDEGRVKNRMARESGEVGIYQGLTFWTPNVNLFRDPRWGRGMESYGEDPYMLGRMGSAVVKGLQGPEDSPVLKAHACAKHFAVHSGPESKRHTYNAWVSERDFRESYLPAFKELVTKAGVKEVMTAYNRVNGIPAAANSHLVNDILRGEWGFKGLVMSDCWAIPDFFLPGHHEFAPDTAAAAAAAVINGVNLECGVTFFSLPEAVKRGLISEKQIDKRLLPLLAERFRLGEIDGKSPWDTLPNNTVESDEHKALSLKMARESIVLLQNKNNILPLKKNASIAVVGPNADDKEMMWGNYNGVPETSITLLEAVRSRIPKVKYVRGCGILAENLTPESVDSSLRESFLPKLNVYDILTQLKGVDIVIFAGGISPRFEGEERTLSVRGFEGGDRTDIELPEVQRELIQILRDAGKKVILVNFSGGATALYPETNTCEAIVQAWYPGQMGGEAIAEVLFGDVNPSGKLPVTFYASTEQLPDFMDYNMEGHTYRFFRDKPLFEFGFGLSYTSFKYGDARVEDGALVVPVSNVGKRDGDEIVQLYVKKPGDPDGPIKTLRGFQRVSVPKGETVEVRLPLTDDTFSWWDEDAWNVKPVHGSYILMYGPSSADSSLKTIDYIY